MKYGIPNMFFIVKTEVSGVLTKGADELSKCTGCATTIVKHGLYRFM